MSVYESSRKMSYKEQVAFELGYKKGLHDAVKQEWISVKDRLPEQYAVVIVYDGEQVGEAEFNGVDFGWVESEDLAFATHWMPFPEPPERMDGE